MAEQVALASAPEHLRALGVAFRLYLVGTAPAVSQFEASASASMSAGGSPGAQIATSHGPAGLALELSRSYRTVFDPLAVTVRMNVLTSYLKHNAMQPQKLTLRPCRSD